jgi:hypothetical protein
VSDIQLVSLREYMEQLSVSFNSQDQAPDYPYAHDRRCPPCIFVDIPPKGRQVVALTNQDILHLFLQLVSQDSDTPFRLTSTFRGLSFSFVAFGSDLLVKVCFVFFVLTLEVTPRIDSMIHVFSSTIHVKTVKS